MQAALEGRGADRLHHRFADRLADRRAHSPALHGRRGGPAVPRVRRNPGRHHHHFRRGLADPDADDVLAHSAPQPGRDSRAASIGRRSGSSTSMIGFYGRTLKVVLALPDPHPAGRPGHTGPDHLPLHRHSQGILPGAGYRRDPGHFAGARNPSRSRPWRRSSRSWRTSSCQDPAVESLSSFIGADGTNTTLNSGRMSINLKPLEPARPAAPPT